MPKGTILTLSCLGAATVFAVGFGLSTGFTTLGSSVLLLTGALVCGTFFGRQYITQSCEDWITWLVGLYMVSMASVTFASGTQVFGLLGFDVEPTTLAGSVAILLALWAGRVYGTQGMAASVSVWFSGAAIAVGALCGALLLWGSIDAISLSLTRVLAVISLIAAVDAFFFFVHTPARSFRAAVHGVAFIVSLPILFLLMMPGGMTPVTGSVPTQGEIVPSPKLTYYIASSAVASSMQSALFGMGPSEFVHAWYRYRPLEVNQTPLWDQEPHAGYSYILTSVIEYGLLFAAACAAGFVWLFFRASRQYRAHRAQLLVVSLMCAGLALATSMPPTMVLVLLAVFVGAQWGALDVPSVRIAMSSLTRVLVGIAAGGVIVLGLLILMAWNNERAVQKTFFARGVTLAESGSYMTAHMPQQYALMVSLRLRLQFIADMHARALARGALTPDEVAALVEGSVQAVDFSETLRRWDGRLSTVLAGVQHRLFLIQMSDQKPAQVASLIATMQKERMHNPIDPRPPYWLGVGYLFNSELLNARRFTELALVLKPDYAEAQQLLAEIRRIEDTRTYTE